MVSPRDIGSFLTELWSPRVVAALDDAYVKVAKVQGRLAWHSHEHEDELFYVLKGRLVIEMGSRNAELSEGQTFVVPKGVRNNSVCEDEYHVMLIERKSTVPTRKARPRRSAGSRRGRHR